MNQPLTTLCTIVARAGSKGVKNKNIRSLQGKPLIAHTIEQAVSSQLFNNIVISTDSEEIGIIAQQFGASYFFNRPHELAQDQSAKTPAIRHALLESERHFNTTYDIHVDLDATSPLRSVDDIKNALNQLIKNKNDILITGCPARRSPYFNLVEIENNSAVLSKKLRHPVVRRQDGPKCYDMNASIYVWTRDALLNNDSLFSGNTGLYVMPEERSIDIDSELDFKFIELLMSERQKAPTL